MIKNDVTDLQNHRGHRAEHDDRSNSSMADFDIDAYRPYLDGLDLTDAQADELIRVVWSIMRMFVEMNLPVDSCGQIVQGLIEQTPDESVTLD